MAELADDDYLFVEMTLEPSGETLLEDCMRLASQVAEAIRSPDNNTTVTRLEAGSQTIIARCELGKSCKLPQ